MTATCFLSDKGNMAPIKGFAEKELSIFTHAAIATECIDKDINGGTPPSSGRVPEVCTVHWFSARSCQGLNGCVAYLAADPCPVPSEWGFVRPATETSDSFKDRGYDL